MGIYFNNTVEILTDLAEERHLEERKTETNHKAQDCEKCVAIARARQMIEQADEYGESVVLYIP